jgi:GxxExxY protein
MSYFDYLSRNAPKEQPDSQLTERVIGAAIEVHSHLGPGLPELSYEAALCHEFDLRGIRYERQVPVDIRYKGKSVGEMRLDSVVEGKLIVELKACESLNPVHRAQCVSYLRATGHQLALLINFNVAILKDGIKRVILSS